MFESRRLSTSLPQAPKNWLDWKKQVIVDLQAARKIWQSKCSDYTDPTTGQKGLDDNDVKEFSSFYKLCFDIETTDPNSKEDLDKFLKLVNELNDYLSPASPLKITKKFSIETIPSIAGAANYHFNEMRIADLLESGINSTNILSQNGIEKEVDGFHKKVRKVKNYNEFHLVIQEALKENENRFYFSFLTRTKLKTYINDFQKHFNAYLLGQQSIKFEKTQLNCSRVPSEFLNVHIQVFNNLLVKELNTEINKINTTLFYKTMNVANGNEVTNDDLNFISKKLRDKLLNIDNFTASPDQYLELIQDISEFFLKQKEEKNQEVSEESAAILNGIKWKIYNYIFIQNNPFPFNRFKLLNSASTPTEEKFYSEIPESCKEKAIWAYSKRYLRDLSQKVEEVNEGFLSYLALKAKNLLIQPQVSKLKTFKEEFQTQLSTLLADKNNSKANVFKYLDLLYKNIKHLKENKSIDQRSALLDILKSQLAQYLEYIINNNENKFQFDVEDLALINALAKKTFNKDEKRRYQQELLDLFKRKIITKDDLEKGIEKFNKFANDDFANHFSSKYAEKNIQDVYEQGKICPEFTQTDDKESETLQIKINKDLNTFNNKLKRKLRGALLANVSSQGSIMAHAHIGKANDAKLVFTMGGVAAGLIPVVGMAVRGVMNVAGSQVAHYMDEEHEDSAKEHPEIPIKKIDSFAEFIARKLTTIYEQQIGLILSGSYDDLITAMVERVCFGLAHAKSEESLENLAQLAVLSVLQSNRISGYMGVLTTPVYGPEDKNLIQCKGYTSESMLSACGIVVYDENGENPKYYGKYFGKHALYGFRRGTERDVEQNYLHELNDAEKKACGSLINYEYQLSYTGLSKPNFSSQNKDNEMINQIEQQEQRINKIENESVQHGQKIKELTKENAILREQNNSNSQQIENLTVKLADQEKITSELKKENDDLRAENGSNSQQIENLTRKLAVQEKTTSEMTEQLAEQRKITEELQKQMKLILANTAQSQEKPKRRFGIFSR